MKKRIIWLFSAILLALVLAILPLMVACAKPAPAPEVFPSKSISFLLCGVSGDAFDSVGRSLAPTLTKKLGVMVLPMNVKGPKAVDFFDALYGAEPDGHTLGFVSNSEMNQHRLRPGVLKFDVAKFPVVLVINTYPDCVFASAKSKLGLKTASELLNAKQPIRVADYASLTPGAVSVAIVAKERNLDLRPVAYTTYGEGHVAMVRGDVDILTATPSGTTLRYVRSGEYIPIMVWGEKRFENLPDTPCSRELGLPEKLAGTMLRRLFVTTPGTPPARITKLAEAIKATLTDPGVVEWSKKAEQPITFITPEEYQKVDIALIDFYKQNLETIKPLIK